MWKKKKKRTPQVTNVWIISLIMQNSHHETQASMCFMHPTDTWNDVYEEYFLRGLMMKWCPLKLVRKRQLLQGRGSDTSKWSSILIPLPKGHASDRVGHYWSMWLIYLLSSPFSWSYMFAGWHAVWTATDSRVLVNAPFRSIPAPENVPRGSWLLDDHVLQHHPPPLHLLTHLQPFPADGWEHEVSHSISLSLSFCLTAPFPSFSASHFLEPLYAPLWLGWLI